MLIDEIENGIHYSNHESFWTMLFDLVIHFKMQLFATTHSIEMMNAFKDAVKSHNYQDYARYFELGRHVNTQQITIQKIPFNAFEEKILTQKPLRGEKL